MGDNEKTARCPDTDTIFASEEGEEGEHKRLMHRLIKAHFNQVGKECKDKGMEYTPEQIIAVLDRCKAIFQEQPMMLQIKPPLMICGDIHGQYIDLKRIFRTYGKPPNVTYLFLGDYVDRGRYSLEVIMLLFAMKARYPHTIFLVRGNHECMNVNRIYGFFDELQRRGLLQLYPEFNNVFNWMPITALIGTKLLCMHGGISKELKRLDQINELERPLTMQSPPKVSTLAIDLLWADPDKKVLGYHKSKRGVSYKFGSDVLEEFCRKFNLDLIVRAHEVVARGFERFPPNEKTRLVTMFSAPNYCGDMDNAAAVMQVSPCYGIKFHVLDPSTDQTYAAARDMARANVPAYDVFPTCEVEFDTNSIMKAADTVSSATTSAAKKTTQAIKKIPFREYSRNTKKGISNFVHSFKRDQKEPKKGDDVKKEDNENKEA